MLLISENLARESDDRSSSSRSTIDKYDTYSDADSLSLGVEPSGGSSIRERFFDLTTFAIDFPSSIATSAETVDRKATTNSTTGKSSNSSSSSIERPRSTIGATCTRSQPSDRASSDRISAISSRGPTMRSVRVTLSAYRIASPADIDVGTSSRYRHLTVLRHDAQICAN